jgi:hypothetical protein
MQINLIGCRFTRLLVIEKAIPRGWYCLCDCGAKVIVKAYRLKDGHTKSCGCWKRDQTIIRNTKHGLRYLPIYRIWKAIRERCYYPKHKSYKDYGGRGIEVCTEWRAEASAFIEWAMANGYQKGLTIDRINTNGDYSPDNCRFVTHKENCNNRRNSKLRLVG